MDKNLEKRSFFAYDRNQQNVLQETRLIKDRKQAKKMTKGAEAMIRRSSIEYTFPVLSQPMELGADIIMHLATKYVYGHVDVMARFLAVKGER
ncbi:cystathionine beta-lyase, chloroplastic-like [Papaver somniferum]|uniref:cystathionine beta-lyase, chloroplastic-like n=1 Tax=Papaver somniferum TaxID=3469 RepID=UPI000E6F74B7|nr:cystathionine beta-lyase, chloroplastic-like [Papaver somniferum]